MSDLLQKQGFETKDSVRDTGAENALQSSALTSKDSTQVFRNEKDRIEKSSGGSLHEMVIFGNDDSSPDGKAKGGGGGGGKGGSPLSSGMDKSRSENTGHSKSDTASSSKWDNIGGSMTPGGSMDSGNRGPFNNGMERMDSKPSISGGFEPSGTKPDLDYKPNPTEKQQYKPEGPKAPETSPEKKSPATEIADTKTKETESGQAQDPTSVDPAKWAQTKQDAFHVRKGESLSVIKDYPQRGSEINDVVVAESGSTVIASDMKFDLQNGKDQGHKDGRSIVIAEKGSQVSAQNGSFVIAERGSRVNAEPGAIIMALSDDGKSLKMLDESEDTADVKWKRQGRTVY